MFIIGLGNKGEEYKNTRHNAGMMFVQFVRDEYENNITKDFHYNKYTDSDEAVVRVNDQEITLVIPQTFMNLSGGVVKKLIKYYEISNTDIVVAHDDLDLVVGRYSIQLAKGPHSHNGILSVESSIGKDFKRVRIGIDGRSENMQITGEDYVLSRFLKEELSILNNTYKAACKDLLSLD